jgi:hypothetical protein
MKLRPAFAFTASFILAAASYLAPLWASAQTMSAQSTTTIPGAVMTTNGDTTTVTGTGTSTTATTAGTTAAGTTVTPTSTPPTTTGTTAADTTVTPTSTPPTTAGVTGGISGARDAFVLTCVFDVRTTPLSFVVFEASGTGTPPRIAPGSFCSQALGTLLASGFTLAASLPTFEGATQYTFVR